MLEARLPTFSRVVKQILADMVNVLKLTQNFVLILSVGLVIPNTYSKVMQSLSIEAKCSVIYVASNEFCIFIFGIFFPFVLSNHYGLSFWFKK